MLRLVKMLNGRKKKVWWFYNQRKVKKTKSLSRKEVRKTKRKMTKQNKQQQKNSKFHSIFRSYLIP